METICTCGKPCTCLSNKSRIIIEEQVEKYRAARQSHTSRLKGTLMNKKKKNFIEKIAKKGW